ncbi:unnamed protein product [Chironomus riparius]|uniref:MD-2-related lipid-recognition domain-containing protein n=1 Tax=Chironomus riparius TaxID=315576 RepID=A0A9N9RSH5_9DIPT|nr:unnamed protein product [Chironomus riparius]
MLFAVPVAFLTILFSTSNAYVVAVSRETKLLQIDAEILKPIPKVKVTLEILYKISGFRNFHQFVIIKDVDICNLFKTANEKPIIFFTDCMQVAPGICHQCPYTGSLKYNSSFTYDQYCPKMGDSRNPMLETFSFWPDGEYKHIVTIVIPNNEVVVVTFYINIKTGSQSEF